MEDQVFITNPPPPAEEGVLDTVQRWGSQAFNTARGLIEDGMGMFSDPLNQQLDDRIADLIPLAEAEIRGPATGDNPFQATNAVGALQNIRQMHSMERAAMLGSWAVLIALMLMRMKGVGPKWLSNPISLGSMVVAVFYTTYRYTRAVRTAALYAAPPAELQELIRRMGYEEAEPLPLPPQPTMVQPLTLNGNMP